MFLCGVVVGFFPMILFSTTFLIYKATEMCHCHMTELPNEAFKWDEDLLVPKEGKKCSNSQRIKPWSKELYEHSWTAPAKAAFLKA